MPSELPLPQEIAFADEDSPSFGYDANVDLVDLIDQPAWKTILLDLVRTEKMDPWNIDVAELAHKYLIKINSMEKADLRVPANAILASAILLKHKAKYLRLSSLDEFEDDVEGAMAKQQFIFDESQLPDLHGLRKFREGSVTLDDLVNSIESILQKTQEKRIKARLVDIPVFRIPGAGESIEARVEKLWLQIVETADSQGIVLFSRLLGNKRDALEIVGHFVPMLFLMNKGKIFAWQDEFFGEIFIQTFLE